MLTESSCKHFSDTVGRLAREEHILHSEYRVPGEITAHCLCMLLSGLAVRR